MASRSPVNRDETSIREVPADSQYLSSNCVVYVYYSDVRAVIEEHFSKALGSQQQNFPGEKSKDPVIPMAQRNLPLSFWKADFQPTGQNNASHSQAAAASTSQETSTFFMPTSQHHPQAAGHAPELYGAESAYHHHHHHHSSRYPIHHQSDPWHYTLSAASASNPYGSHHRSGQTSSMHDLGYSSASNRFNAQYSSLLLQPSSMRSSRLAPVAGPCSAFEKAAPDMSWLGAASRYHQEAMNFASSHHGMDAAGYSASAAYGAAMTAAISGMESH